uniref:Uncharacterized protein n=1 Tax=Pseudo-nitzschia australis TaxID=44445 RepID=A0A7S4EH49_9STRA
MPAAEKDKTKPPSTTTISNNNNSSSNNNNINSGGHPNNNKIQEFMDSTVSTVRTNVGSAEATIKKAVEELSTGDLLSVYGIVFLMVVIALAPSLIRRLQSSDGDGNGNGNDSNHYHYNDNDNDNGIGSEDPVMDLARMIRGEYLDNMNRNRNKTKTNKTKEVGNTNSDGNGTSDGDSNTDNSINDNDNDNDNDNTDDQNDDSSSTSSAMGLDRIVADLLKSPQIQEAATTLVTNIIQSPRFKTACTLLLRELLKDLLDDPDTLAQVVRLLQKVVADDRIREAAVQLATDIFGDDRVLDELVTLVQRLGTEHKVRNATRALLVESAHNALNDPEILDHSMEFATDVVGDDVVQQTAGEALYNTMSYAFRPALSLILALTGIGLIFVSVAAFRNVNQTPSDAADRAFLNAIERYTTRMTKLLFFPLDFLVACKDALVGIVLFPFRFVSSGVTRANQFGKGLFGAARHWFLWLIHLPFELLSSLLWGSKHVLDTACTNLVDRLNDSIVSLVRAANELSSVIGVPFQKLAQWSSWLLETTTDRLHGAWVCCAAANQSLFVGVPLEKLEQLSSTLLERTKIQWIALNDTICDRVLRLERFGEHVCRTVVRVHTALDGLFPRLASVRRDGLSMKQHKKEYFDELSRGYESLNRSLATFAFWVEDLLRKIVGTI